jgi:AcrR family transcriptional regulator
MTSTALDFKEQMAETRRKQILLGAAQVFAQKGYHRATTKEIAQAAEVSEGTIYNYFADKRGLLVAMMELVSDHALKDILPQEQSRNPRAFLTALLQNLYNFLQERRQFAAPILAEVLADAGLRQSYYRKIIEPLIGQLEHYLRQHTYAGRLRQRDATVTAYSLLGAVLLNLVLSATHLDPRYQQVSPDAIIEQMVALFLDGLHSDSDLAWLIG